MSEVRKVIKHSIINIGFAGVIYLGLMLVLTKVKVNDVPLVYRASEAITQKGGASYAKFQEDYLADFDLAIIGSSHAYRGYDPEIFEHYGISAFNFGTSGQSPSVSLLMAREYVLHQPYEKVIVDVSEVVMSSSNLECISDLIQNVPDNGLAVKLALKSWDIRAINMYTIRMFNNEVLYESSNYKWRGYCENPDSLSQLNHIYSGQFQFKSQQLEDLTTMLTELQESGKEVVVVSHPIPLDHSKERLDAYSDTITNLCNRVDVRFMDYTRKHQLHSLHHFYDHGHLNKAGVDWFNNRLVEDLKSIDFF